MQVLFIVVSGGIFHVIIFFSHLLVSAERLSTCDSLLVLFRCYFNIQISGNFPEMNF